MILLKPKRYIKAPQMYTCPYQATLFFECINQTSLLFLVSFDWISIFENLVKIYWSLIKTSTNSVLRRKIKMALLRPINCYRIGSSILNVRYVLPLFDSKNFVCIFCSPWHLTCLNIAWLHKWDAFVERKEGWVVLQAV